MWINIKRIIPVFVVILIFLWFLQWISSSIGQPYLWMHQLKYTRIFWSVLFARWSICIIPFIFVFVVTYVNFSYAARIISLINKETDVPSEGSTNFLKIKQKYRALLFVIIAIVLGYKFAGYLSPQWQKVFDFRVGTGFDLTEPIFGRDAGFYVYSLPLYSLIQKSLSALVLVQFAAMVLFYLYCGCIRARKSWSWVNDEKVAGHLTLILTLGLGCLAWGCYLNRFSLLCRQHGVVFGVGYTADHISTICLAVVSVASIFLGAFFVRCLFCKRYHLVAPLLVFLGGLYLVLIILIPGAVQKYIVVPNELQLETRYLKHNIDFTRKAFQLENVKVKAYPTPGKLTRADLTDNQKIIDNIRIWNAEALLPSLRQTQEMRSYYQFYQVDVDRYRFDGGYHEVLLSARELASRLPKRARTWVNRHLQFTHGYGLVMNFDSKKEAQGQPVFVIDDIPPKSNYNISVDRPQLYYGENMPGYRIVKTAVKEFDYPKGDLNVYADYKGSGGILLDSFIKKFVLALARCDINILLSSYLRQDSRMQIWTSVSTRVKKIAPFLTLDKDPYLVLSNGKLFWIQDAYTVSKSFPYAEPHTGPNGRVSYIRNSVKVIIDAYNGSVRFFVSDSNDPILYAYQTAFPELFNPLSSLPMDLKQHLRYPKALFAVQSDVFKAYHMINPQVFYNQEDLWSDAFKERPVAKKGGGDQFNPWVKKPELKKFKPYYMLSMLPGSKRLEYLLMTSFTPKGRDNMISWMAAQCDFPDYGRLTVYKLPKEHLSYGLGQVQAMINQHPVISQQLSLWDQKGSKVILGDLIAVPISDSFLYVEPVYLTTQSFDLPQLKRVIAIQGDRVAMAPTLNEAVLAVVEPPQAQPGRLSKSASAALSFSLDAAASTFERARKALSKGDWKDFGTAMDQLKTILTPEDK